MAQLNITLNQEIKRGYPISSIKVSDVMMPGSFNPDHYQIHHRDSSCSGMSIFPVDVVSLSPSHLLESPSFDDKMMEINLK